MNAPTRGEIFAQAANKLRVEFDELKASIPHAGAKGGEAERLIRRFLNDHIPQRFKAGSGFIIDHNDVVSKQTDVIIYDALNCPVYRASDEAGIYPSDNVAAIVEVKSNLDKERLFEAADNIAAAKSLAKTPEANLPIITFAGTRGCVFAFDSPLDLETLAQHYRETVIKHGLVRHIDCIAILDRGLQMLATHVPGHHGWAMSYFDGGVSPASEGCHLAIASMQTGKATLDAFLRFLLPQLTLFRSLVDHPGFVWSGKETTPLYLIYLASITLEQDPVKREQKLKQYKQQAIEESEKFKNG